MKRAADSAAGSSNSRKRHFSAEQLCSTGAAQSYPIHRSSSPRSAPNPVQIDTNESGQPILLQGQIGPVSETQPQSEDDNNRGFGKTDLCQRCQRINLRDFFLADYSKPREDHQIMFLGREEEWKTDSCVLCRLLFSISECRHTGRRSAQRLYAFTLAQLDSRGRNKDKSTSAVVLTVGAAKSRAKGTMSALKREQSLARGVIAMMPTDECNGIHDHLQIHTVNPTRPNYQQLRRWVSHCKSHHSDTCNHSVTSFCGPLKLIDCSTNTVVLPTSNQSYFALSYVWGPSATCTQCTDGLKSQSLEQSDSNPDWSRPVFTQLIIDAIEVVRCLDGRYLWVDSYCIDQHNPLEKHDQIGKMDEIYDGAVATIVPIDATCPHNNIPGVSISRAPQVKASIESLRLAVTLPHLRTVARRSAWITRGWTYQELVLSRRCLFFSKEQVHFLCRTMSCSENLDKFQQVSAHNQDANALINPDILYRGVQEKHGIKEVKKNELRHFYEHVSRFKIRNLGHDADSLNALQGLISKLRYKHVWGSPIARTPQPAIELSQADYDSAFAKGLYWDCHHESWLQPIADLPSWSWAGWKGHISRAWQEEYYNETFSTRFAVCPVTGGRLTIKEWIESNSLRSSEISIGRSLICEGLFVDLVLEIDSKMKLPGRFLRATPRALACKGEICHSLQDPTTDNFRRRLENQHCLGLFLYRSSHIASYAFDTYRVLLLLVDETGKASRIGYLDLYPDRYGQWPKSRRTVEFI